MHGADNACARATQSAGSNSVKVLSCAPYTALDGFDNSAASVAGWVLTQGCLFKCLFHGIEHDISSSYSNFMGGSAMYYSLFSGTVHVFVSGRILRCMTERDREEVGTEQGEERG